MHDDVAAGRAQRELERRVGGRQHAKRLERRLRGELELGEPPGDDVQRVDPQQVGGPGSRPRPAELEPMMPGIT
ncbi:MAG: hypothetical protein U1F06_07725 [Steroidobacteraceae bacterium]